MKFSPKKLKDLRSAYKTKAEDLAKALGVSRPTISHWERGKSVPTMENLYLIAKYFDCTEDELKENDPSDAFKTTSEKIMSIFRMAATQRGQSLEDFLYPLAQALGKRVLENPEITDPELIREAEGILKQSQND